MDGWMMDGSVGAWVDGWITEGSKLSQFIVKIVRRQTAMKTTRQQRVPAATSLYAVCLLILYVHQGINAIAAV